MKKKTPIKKELPQGIVNKLVEINEAIEKYNAASNALKTQAVSLLEGFCIGQGIEPEKMDLSEDLKSIEIWESIPSL